MDRSVAEQRPPMSALAGKIVRTDRVFYFIGALRREVVFSVSATDMADAWRSFKSSKNADTEIIFVIKSETEIYLA
jgi:hypothetical protein